MDNNPNLKYHPTLMNNNALCENTSLPLFSQIIHIVKFASLKKLHLALMRR